MFHPRCGATLNFTKWVKLKETQSIEKRIIFTNNKTTQRWTLQLFVCMFVSNSKLNEVRDTRMEAELWTCSFTQLILGYSNTLLFTVQTSLKSWHEADMYWGYWVAPGPGSVGRIDGVSDLTPEPESGGGDTWQHSWQCTQHTWHHTWSVGIIAGVSVPTPEPEQSAVQAHYKQRAGGDAWQYTWQHTSQYITYLRSN